MAPVPEEKTTKKDMYLWTDLLTSSFSPWAQALCNLLFPPKQWTLAFSRPVPKQPPSHPLMTEMTSGLWGASVLMAVTVLVCLRFVWLSLWVLLVKCIKKTTQQSHQSLWSCSLCKVFLLRLQWQFFEIIPVAAGSRAPSWLICVSLPICGLLSFSLVNLLSALCCCL